ncbi:MAG TPA: DUF883 family protein [Burkholderiales bacterium]|jgi:ElaB/YqjD/DUF883 family membrane-anchored ribosome-binding protein|nr:DUF883 family protein [Burkholderiales bacterium]
MNAPLTQKLRQDLQTVVLDAEDLLKATASQTGEQIARLRARAEESIGVARARLAEAGTAAGQNVRDVAQSVDGEVHSHPYVAAGVAAGVGLLVGLLIGRR